jgi:tetratricopeptide (TPR) repeat protein
MANAFMGMGYIKWRRGDFPKSLEMFSKSLQYAKIDNSLRTIGKLYLSIGDLFQQRGDMDKSIDYYIRGIKHLETIGDSLAVSQGHSSIARVNMDRGDLDAADASLRQALEKAKEKGRPDFKPPHIQLLKLRSMQGRFEDARLAFETLMDSLNSEEEKVFFALANMNYGEICSIEGRRAESESLLMKALDTFTALDMPYELGRTKAILADHYARNDERPIARDLLLEAQGIFKSIGAKAQFDATVGKLASLGR